MANFDLFEAEYIAQSDEELFDTPENPVDADIEANDEEGDLYYPAALGLIPAMRSANYCIVMWYYENHKTPHIKLSGFDPVIANKIRREVQAKAKAESRERRCRKPDGKGGWIMCPEKNKCKDCKERLSLNFTTNLPVSLSSTQTIVKNGEIKQEPIDVASDFDLAGTVEEQEFAVRVLERLHAIDPLCAKIYALDREGYTAKEIKNEIGRGKTQTNELIKKAKKLAGTIVQQLNAE